MQGNTQVSWLATRSLILSLRALGNKHNNIPYIGVLIPRAFGNKLNNIPWFRGYARVLIPRAFGNKSNNMPWFPGYAGVLIPRAFGINHNNNNNYNPGIPLSHESWPCESMGQKGDLHGALHPLQWFIYFRKMKLRRHNKILELAYASFALKEYHFNNVSITRHAAYISPSAIGWVAT